MINTQTTTSTAADVIINQNKTANVKSNHITLKKGYKIESGGCLNATIVPCE